jgi:predicted nucleic acid-binding protein
VKRVFVDSGGWYAHLVSDDADHQTTRQLFQRARDERWSLVTTNAVVYEAHALLRLMRFPMPRAVRTSTGASTSSGAIAGRFRSARLLFDSRREREVLARGSGR